MWVYASGLSLLTAWLLTSWLLIWAGEGRRPVMPVRTALGLFRRDARFRALLLAMLGLLGANWVENRFEHVLARWIPWDFTPAFARVWPELLLAIQRFEWAPLTHLMVFIYVVVFPVLPLASMLIYAGRKDLLALRLLFRDFGLTYLIALPFYFLLPVREAWTANAGIRFLIPPLYPAFEEQFRQWSALDNCFPSLHTSLAISAALVAHRTGYPRLARLFGGIAVLVAFSTLYLGVHWIPDLLGGVLLAFGVARLNRAPVRCPSPTPAL